jgi:UDP-2,3-diacylglucosamine pyrophosphatase LpxH
MMTESDAARNRLPENRSIIVVSDLHLGGKEDPDTARRFCNFLDYINNDFASAGVNCGKCKGSPEKDSGKIRKLLQPDKIVLLGDVLELWDSRNIDRNSSFLDAFIPFLKLRDMDCDVIYVTGNHDEDTAELVTSVAENEEFLKNAKKKGSENTGSVFWKKYYRVISEPDRKNHELAEGIEIPWNPGSSRNLRIFRRHYAPCGPDKKMRGIESANTHYAFLHGQQFDKEQITYTISKALEQRFDPVDFLQDLASISASREMGRVTVIINVLCTLGLIWLLGTPMNILLGFLFGLALIFIFIYGTAFFSVQDTDSNPSAKTVALICAILTVGTILLVAMFQFVALYWLALFISLFISITIAVPRLFALSKRILYNSVSSRTQSPETIIEKKLFDPEKYGLGAEVLVFGHTHVPDFGESKSHVNPDKKTLLVNTGTWVRENLETAETSDTFAYIDNTGICLLRWVECGNDKGHVECLCRKRDDRPLCHSL